MTDEQSPETDAAQLQADLAKYGDRHLLDSIEQMRDAAGIVRRTMGPGGGALVAVLEQGATDLERLAICLSWIVDEVVVPDAFPDWDALDEVRQIHVSALLLARLALESNGETDVEPAGAVGNSDLTHVKPNT